MQKNCNLQELSLISYLILVSILSLLPRFHFLYNIRLFSKEEKYLSHENVFNFVSCWVYGVGLGGGIVGTPNSTPRICSQRKIDHMAFSLL